MVNCDTCGGSDFYNEDGYMYCSECQTQSQKFYVQEAEVSVFTSQVKKKKKKRTGASENLTIGDLWTSWDAYNYILLGMTEELQKLSFAPKKFKDVVLQLWACHLQKSEVAFISRTREKKPKLGFLYRRRDSRILYGFCDLIPKKKKKRKMSSIKSSHKSMNTIKKKFFDKYFEEYSASQASTQYLSDSIETLAPSSTKSVSASESEGMISRSLRDIFASSDNITYKKYKDLMKVPKLKYAKRININYFCKSKLLAAIHLALLLNGSAIQLGDILRFIRETHLSFAKVTHFLPEDFKLSKGDVSFMETIRDGNMPTHLMQRKVARTLARSLNINEVSFPDMRALVYRYCAELNLPDIIAKYSLTVLKHVDVEKMCILKRTQYLPNFEAVAMATIIFIMKLFFGLDGITELILSDLAEKIISVSSSTDKKLFVFNNWQKHIVCRKALLQSLHYPTEEKLKSNPIGKSKGYLNILMKENKDEGKEQRFKKYNQYYLDPKIVSAVKDVLDFLKEPVNSECLDFPPTLTPNSTYLAAILNIYREGKRSAKLKQAELPELSPKTLDVLNEKFKDQSIDYIIRPNIYKEKLTNGNFVISEKFKSDLIKIKFTSEKAENFESEMKFGKNFDSVKLSQFSKSKDVVFIQNPFDYWILKHPPRDETLLYEFKCDAFSKMSVNFRWFLVECSSMLEMNARELYKELTIVENKMKMFVRRI